MESRYSLLIGGADTLSSLLLDDHIRPSFITTGVSLWTRGVCHASDTRFYRVLSGKWLITVSKLHSGRRVWSWGSSRLTKWRAIHSWPGVWQTRLSPAFSLWIRGARLRC